MAIADTFCENGNYRPSGANCKMLEKSFRSYTATPATKNTLRETYYNECLKDTSSGAPYDRDYTSTDCTGGTGDCRCFLANSIETVIVDQSSESCDNGRLTYTGKTTNSVDYEISKTCLSSCQPRVARRLRSGRSLSAVPELDSTDLDDECTVGGPCRGCKKCKDMQDARNDGKQPFKEPVSRFVFAQTGGLNRDIGGCSTTACTVTNNCELDACEGCKMCHDEAEVLDTTKVAEGTVISTSTINDDDKLDAVFKRRGPQERTSGDGSCMPACKIQFPIDGTNICKWKKCKGCLACTLYRKNIGSAQFDTSDKTDSPSATDAAFFRPRPRTIDSDGTRNANVPTKFYGGCHLWCGNAFNYADGTQLKTNHPSITPKEAREKVCGWRSCSGCLACVKEAERLDATTSEMAYEFRSHDGTNACLGPFLCRSGGPFHLTDKCVC
jgi:hypothetical protein